jgi:hypothetical protein
MTDPTLAELITRRDALKIKISIDQQRHELAQVVGKITQHLHRPFQIESDRLAEKRQELQQQLQTARDQQTQLRCAHGQAHGQRTALLAQGELPTEATSTSKALFSELHDLEAHIGELELAIRGIDGRFVALVEAESINIVSGVSAS